MILRYLFLWMLDSLTKHFIAEEHWCWFDDFYSPDYTLSQIWDKFVLFIRSVRRRLYDYERSISEVLHGFYER